MTLFGNIAYSISLMLLALIGFTAGTLVHAVWL